MEEEKKAETMNTTPQQISSDKPAMAPVQSSPAQSSPNPTPSTPTSYSAPKKPVDKKTVTYMIIAVLLILAIVITILFLFVFNKTGATKETYVYDYSIYSGNSLIDSGTASIQKGKLSSSLGLASEKLDSEISSMTAGQEKNITLDAKDAYGAYDPELNYSIERIEKQDRTNDMNRTTWIDINTFSQAFGEQPELNQEYNFSGAPWPYKVVQENSTHVKISQEASLNQEIPLGTFSYKVTSVTPEKITLKMFGENTIIPTDNGNYIVNFTDNEVITTYSPTIGSTVTLTGYPESKVIGMNSTHVFLDSNTEDAGKTLTIKVKLNEIKQEKSTTGSAIKHIDGAPVFQFFIMSHCPYGTQMAKGVLPVWEKFKDKANIELRFVSYTMHGNQEVVDNNRLLCVREEQSAKLIEYLTCFVYGDGSEASSQACIQSTGLDKTKLDDCVANRADTYMEVDKELNTKYGVQGSPTVVIDGKEASVYPRDPASVAKALCNAFSSKPSECSLSFDTTNPSPGFGGGSASSSGSAASCG